MVGQEWQAHVSRLSNRLSLALVVLSGVIVADSTAARAESITYGFEQLTNNSGSDFSSDFSLVMTFDGTAGTLTFTLSNVSGGSGSLTDVYWHDTDLLLSLTGVDLPPNWNTPASPGSMSNATGFVTRYSSESDPPPTHNGIEGGESADFVFFVTTGTDWDDILASLASNDLRLGFHAQSLGDDGDSEWFLAVGTPVPEPATLLLMGGALAVGVVSRRRRRHGTAHSS